MKYWNLSGQSFNKSVKKKEILVEHVGGAEVYPATGSDEVVSVVSKVKSIWQYFR